MKLSKKYLIAAGVIVVLAVAGGATALIMHKGKTPQPSTSHAATTQTSSKTKTQSSSNPDYANAKLYKIGDVVPYQSETAQINSATTANSISSQYSSPVFADSGTKFVIVNMTITNTTTDPYIYSPFVLIDQKDRLYNAYSNTIGNIDNYLDGSQLSPSVPKTGVEVYQVPQDSTTFRIGGRVGNTSKLELVQFQAQ